MITYKSMYTLSQLAEMIAESAECDALTVLQELKMLLEVQK